jgi:hypothetical protein
MTSADFPDTPATPTALDLAAAEIDHHLAQSGWDQPIRFYALVPTAQLLESEPALSVTLGLPTDVGPDALTPIEQDDLPTDTPLDEWLAQILWPAEVLGCVLAQEVLALPPSVEADVPEDGTVQWASTHPLRREVRMVVGVLRGAQRQCYLRVRSTSTDDELLTGPDLVPLLADALAATLSE